ncbi:TIGR03086 family metal-binding protein [Catenulispora subtropica]|uniref:Mycothiol-dependent maleylpyruvate isomerase metal-binding domain-containing protein n=1 Tax=Catenulispora subtropica TaxID=450798 RepID=A0ABP5C6J4_9ACTN
MTTTGYPVLDASHRALRTVIGALTEDDLTRPTPCTDWTVTQVLRHAAGDQLAFAAFLDGGPGPDANPFTPSATPPQDPKAFLEESLNRSATAWTAVAPDTEEVAVPVPPNKLSARVGAGACALDAAVHAWDIAMAVGRPSPLTPDLSTELLDVARQIVEPLRQFGAYATELPGQDGDDAEAELLRYLGRDPRWTAVVEG